MPSASSARPFEMQSRTAMLEEGYAAVTYRVLAARAGVTGGLVQYYFPNLDDLFLALLGRRSERNVERLHETLASRPDETLRIVWEFSTDETSAALLTEFLALANHRKSIRAAIHEVIERTRNAQLQVLSERWDHYPDLRGLSPEAVLFLLHGIPKMVMLEEAVGMIAARWGRIVTISSSAGQKGSVRQAHYSASKGGVIALSKTLALEYASRGITVNTIPPFAVDTPMLRAARDANLLPPREVVERMIPSGRLGTPDDIATACTFLCSDEAGYITGQVIAPNGGAVL